MKPTIAITGLTLLFAFPVLAQTAAEKTGVNSVMGVAPKTEDFVMEAATSDIFEIEASKLAVERSTDTATMSFAQQMITDHTRTSEELKALVSGRKVKATIPVAMTPSQQNMLDDLKKLEGANFAKLYRSYQEDAHEDAVDIFKRYGSEGENPDLKAWAAATRPALEHHLVMAKDLNK